VSDISAGVPDSPVTFSSAIVEASVSRSDTDRDIRQVSDTAQTSVTSAGQVSDAVPIEGSDTLSHSLNVPGTTKALTGQSRPTTDNAAITPALCGAGPDRVADTPDAYPPVFADVSATLTSDRKRLSAAVDIVRTHGRLSGSDMAKQMGRFGHPMSVRAHRLAVAGPRRGTGSRTRLWSVHAERLGRPTNATDNVLLVRRPVSTSADSVSDTDGERVSRRALSSPPRRSHRPQSRRSTRFTSSPPCAWRSPDSSMRS